MKLSGDGIKFDSTFVSNPLLRSLLGGGGAGAGGSQDHADNDDRERHGSKKRPSGSKPSSNPKRKRAAISLSSSSSTGASSSSLGSSTGASVSVRSPIHSPGSRLKSRPLTGKPQHKQGHPKKDREKPPQSPAASSRPTFSFAE